jgi:hypothetical protein
MDNKPSKGGSIVPVKRDGEDLVDEQIDERILRLLGLEYIFDIDYDTYTSLLKEKMVAARMAKTQIPTEEAELLTNEYKKIRGKKGRFKVKKITAQSLKRGSAVGVNLGKQKALVGKPLKALPPADKMTGGSDIKEIIDALAEIIKSFTSQNKLAKDSAEKSRIAGEAGQRGAKESRLEKGFKFAIKAAEKIIAPIKSLLDRIIDFFVAIFVGRALIKLLDWFSDSKNQDKIKAIGRFLGDQWPKLLALYIMFGTGLGKFVGFLTKIVIRGGIKLAAAAAGLLAKAGVGKAAGAAKFLGGKYGKLLGAGLEVAATVGTTMAVSKGIENFGGIGGEEQKTQGYSGGGFVIPKFAGGGLNFKGMMGGAGMGAMFGPLGMLLGAGLGSGKIQETVSGLIGGKKGVDKVPAMLTDGEFVMSRGAVQKYGVDTLESMNAAGGGTNQPKIVSGTTYAAGGGMIGDIPLHPGVGKNPDDNGLRRHARTFSQNGRFGTEEDLFKAFKKLGGVPDFQKMVGGSDNFSKINQGLYGDDALDTIRKSVVEKLKGVNNPQSKPTPQPQSKPTPQPKPQSSTKIGSALDNTTSALDDAIKSNKRGLRDTGFKLGSRIAPEHRMLPAAGQSSANMMKAVRAPIPASRAIVPYAGGGALARQGGGGLATKPLQQIGTNMNVSPGRAAGFIKGAKTLGVELLLQYFLDKGMNYLDAKRISGIVDKASKASSEKRDAYIESVRKDLDKEKRHQKSLGGIFDKIIKMGGETGSERMSRNQESLLAALGSKSYQGGAIKGGFGLKDQSFKDMPKTQIMSDDKGRPFVGYKSMRGGKPVYVRGPQPGEGTSNPLEMMGRMINPGAYKDVDALSEQKKYQQASAGSISSLKARGASQLTLANRQSQLKKSIPAVPSKSKVKVVYAPSPAGGGMGGRRGSGASPSVPSFSAVHPNSESRRRSAAVLGVK